MAYRQKNVGTYWDCRQRQRRHQGTRRDVEVRYDTMSCEEMKMTEDKIIRRNKRATKRRRWMEGVCSVCPDSEPPAKQMMINEAAGKLAPRSVRRMESCAQVFFSLITSHLPLTLPQPLSSTISSPPGPARRLPLVPDNRASSTDRDDWLMGLPSWSFR